TLSATALAFAGVVDGGRLHALAGATMPGGQELAVAVGATPLDPHDAGMAPSLVLAFEPARDALSGLGLFIDTGDDGDATARALARSAWQLLDAGGVAHEAGVLRSHEGAGGVRLLAQRLGRSGFDGGAHAGGLLRGPYGPQCWVFPIIPDALRAVGRPPRAIAGALARLVPPEHASAYDRPLTWVQVQLPAEARGAAAAIRRVVVNCACASNLDVQAQRLSLGQMGDLVTRELHVGDGRHLREVLDVVGEHGDAYAVAGGAGAEIAPGQYRARGAVVRVRAARGGTGRFDRHVTVRSISTDGARGNTIGAGDVRQLGAMLASPTAQVVNLTPARGGGAPPPPAAARVRFAELLRTRERAVTPADVDIAVRAYEPRVVATDVRSSIAVDDTREPGRVEIVTVDVRGAEFDDPAAELVRLAAGLERHLQERSAPSTHVRVRVRSVDGLGHDAATRR
ncbi:MAG TPA: hypothetical protein VGD56_15645, partial [Gemmatirosa sp.]